MVELIDLTKRQKFTPRKYQLNFDINTETELQDFQEEFNRVWFSDYAIDFSGVLYNIIEKLRKVK